MADMGDILNFEHGPIRGPTYHAMPCPRCGEKAMTDDSAGGLHCKACGHTQQMGWDDPESWMEGKFNWDFNLPLEGMSQTDEPGERNWVIPTRNFGPTRFGGVTVIPVMPKRPQRWVQEMHGRSRPFTYEPEQGIVAVGPAGASSHNDLSEYHNEENSYQGRLYLHPDGRQKVLEFYNLAPPAPHVEAVAQALGASSAQIGDWHEGTKPTAEKNAEPLWKFEAKAQHQLNWDPGTDEREREEMREGGEEPDADMPGWGKGILMNDGSVHTWNTRAFDGTPTHSQYVDRRLGPQYGFGAVENTFIIRPDAVLKYYWGPPKDDSLIKQADPRLIPPSELEGEERWHLAHTHVLNYQPGTAGKGLILPDGTIHTWNTNEGPWSGEPHHTQYLQKQGFHPSMIRESQSFWIKPDGHAEPWLPELEGTGLRNINDTWSFEASTRSLYHGTLIDHLPSIEQHGLIPEVGSFVSDAYDLHQPDNPRRDNPEEWYDPEEIGVRPAVFMADKKRLQRSLNAIMHGVSQKLDKPSWKLTPQDVQEHGLLVKVKGAMGLQDPPAHYVYDEEHAEPFEEGTGRGEGDHPYQAEPGDFYSESPVSYGEGAPGGLETIRGPAMMRVFERHGLVPWDNPFSHAAATGHQLNWDLGQWGKGVVHNGDVHTWNTDSFDGNPTHFDYIHKQHLNVPPEESIWENAFQIWPEGEVNFYGDHGWEDNADLVYKADPRLGEPDADVSKKWRFANATHTWHYNRWTGKRCNCPWNAVHLFLRKVAGPNLNKVLKAPDKKLNTPEGQEFKDVLASRLGEEYESLAPYIAHRFKSGDIRVKQNYAGSMGPRDPHLEMWNWQIPLEDWRKDMLKREMDEGEKRLAMGGELHRLEGERGGYASPEREHRIEVLKSELARERAITPDARRHREDERFSTLEPHQIPNWHEWYEARQHPLRQGVNIMAGDWTPRKMDEIARLHRKEVQREKEAVELRHHGYTVHEFPAVKQKTFDGIDWEAVRDNEVGNVANPLPPERIRQLQELEGMAQNEGELGLKVRPEDHQQLESLAETYPKWIEPRKAGWHIKQLQNGEDLYAEGKMMGHCIGNDEKYANCLDHELIDVYSLRGPKGEPHVTWHYNSDGSLAEIFGPNDDPVKPEYQQMLNEWGAKEGRDVHRDRAIGHNEFDPEEDRELPSVYFPAAQDMSEYINYHHPDFYYQAANEDEEGRTVGEHTDFNWEEPKWDTVAEDYASQFKKVYHPLEGLDAEQTQKTWDRHYNMRFDNFHAAINQHSHEREFRDALQDYIDGVYGQHGEHMEPGEKPDEGHVENIARWNDAFPKHEVHIPEGPEEPEPIVFHSPITGQPWSIQEQQSPWTYYHNRQGPTPHAPAEETFGQQQMFGRIADTIQHVEVPDILRMTPRTTPDAIHPVVYHRPTGTIYVGPLRSHHADVEGAVDELDHAHEGIYRGDDNGYGYYYPEDQYYYHFNGNAPKGESDRIAQALGVEDRSDKPDWRFGTITKTADKLHDFLMNPKSRPDLQTPEGQRWLKMLHYYQEGVGDKLDPLTPWLTREWKKGRIHQSEDGTAGHPYLLEPNSVPISDIPGHTRRRIRTADLSHWADFMQSNHPLRREMGDIMQHDIHSFKDRIDNWGADMEAKADAARAEEAAKGGTIVHQHPDGWSVRQLHTPEELENEGDAMGHCVGSYAREVGRGDTMIYSLRDPQGQPHATVEIRPTRWESPDFNLEEAFHMHPTLRHAPESVKNMIREYAEKPAYPNADTGDYKNELGKRVPYGNEDEEWHRNKWRNEMGNRIEQLFNQLYSTHQNDTRKPIPHGGEVEQIQGKSNREPIPEYKNRLRQWFETFPEEDRPIAQAEDDYLSEPNAIEPYHHNPEGQINEYGLRSGPLTVDYDSMLHRMLPEGAGQYRGPTHDYADEIYDLAKNRKEIPELAKHWESHEQEQQASADEMVDQNWEYIHEHIGPHPENIETEEEAQEHGYMPEKGWDKEDRHQAEIEYEEREGEAQGAIMDEHAGYKAATDIGNKLQKHYNGQSYVNDPKAEPPEGQP